MYLLVTKAGWCAQGRLIDHVRNTQSMGLEDLQLLVLDEADRLLEMGFSEEVSITWLRSPIVCASVEPRKGMCFESCLSLQDQGDPAAGTTKAPDHAVLGDHDRGGQIPSCPLPAAPG